MNEPWLVAIAGSHAYVILHGISKIDIEDRSDILCYAIRGPREKAPQALRDRCLLVAYKMFGDHLSLQSIIAILVIIVCIINFIYLFCGMDSNAMQNVESSGMFVQLVLLLLVTLLVFILLYIRYVKRHSCVDQNMAKRKRPSMSIRMCCVAGSGGHTAELLTLMSAFRQQFNNLIYIVSDTDKLSEQKIIEFEKSQGAGNFRIEQISRSREVKQSYITSIFTTIWACIETLFLVWRIRPDAVICNGPGVCLPVCFAVALFDLLRLRDVQLFYVESLCRVKKLSLTGQILYESRITDIFFVHWEDLIQRYPRVVLIPCTK
uniref:UDP-N-acetylglucosamine transferase subunit ALG14 n=1 Tax=Loa loa TaxID=7209 RepID=A0A1I7VAL8_LOALO